MEDVVDSDERDDDDVVELTKPAAGEGDKSPTSFWTLDWGPEYLNCSEWGDIFVLAKGVVEE